MASVDQASADRHGGRGITAKSVRAVLGNIGDVVAICGFKSDDVNYISVYPKVSGWVTINVTQLGFLRAMLKPRVPSNRIGKEDSKDGRIKFTFSIKGLDFITLVTPEYLGEIEHLIQIRKLRMPSFRVAKPKPAPKPAASSRPQWMVPRSVSEARTFVSRYFNLGPQPDDSFLLTYAKQGQIKYHPDRPTGDAHLSRVFNAAATLLKGVTR